MAALTAACNDIKEEDRFITVDEIKPVRAVLIEEFTGQFCVNCPSGHAEIAKLHNQYPDAVIPVSIHASNLAVADGDLGPTFQGLKIPEGETYYANAGSEPLPFAVVDRNSGALSIAQWADAVDKALQKPAPANIEMTAALNNGKIDIDINVLPLEDLACSLQVWVVESGIVSYQDDLNGVMHIDYVHNHVLRAVVNGINGESISLHDNIYSNKKYSYDVLDKWNTDNLAIVAFLYDGSGVLNACEVPVSATTDDETTEQS